MLKTPHAFTVLMDPQQHENPLSFIFHEGRLLVREDDLTLPEPGVAEAIGITTSNVQPVGMLGDRYCQAAWIASAAQTPAGHAWRGLRSLFGAMDDDLLGVAARAAQIAEWARTHRFCGACGERMERLGGERCFRCTSCAMLAYPRISPAMMVLIRKGDAVLLAMHKASPSKRFTPLAGFLEAGESIEEAVHREVYEEVGLRVHNLKYFASQSWPFPHSLMIAFTADYLDGEIRIDANELSEARWFGPDDEWPEPVPHVSVSSVLVDAHRPSREAKA